jgi:hypothetical protein
MAYQDAPPGHLEITETLVRLYVFLTQYVDRCLDQGTRETIPEQEMQAHLTSTRSKMMEILAVNPVVKGKVEKECDRVLSLGATCMKGGAEKAAALAEAKAERAVLRNKTIALSDLLAVFRAFQ